MSEGSVSQEEPETGLAIKPVGGGLADSMTAEQWRAIDMANRANIDQSEIQFSRLAIMQPGSPEIAQQIPGYKPGMIVDNVNREVVSERLATPWLKGKIPDSELIVVDVVEFVPMFKLPSEFIKWKNRNTEGPGMHFKTLDVADPRVRDGIFPPRGRFHQSESQKSPPVTENINIFSLLIDQESRMAKMMPVVITFAKTSFKTGRRLVTACEGMRFQNMPFFGSTFYLYTAKKQNDAQQTYHVFIVAKGSLVSKVCPGVVSMIVDTVSALSDKDTGRERQEAVINAARLDDLEEGDVDEDTTTIPGGTNEAF